MADPRPLKKDIFFWKIIENTQITILIKRSEVNDQFYVKLSTNLNIHLQNKIEKNTVCAHE